MKKLLTIFLVFISPAFTLFAQIPPGYYNAADGLLGEALKDTLHNIIKGHVEKSYGDARYILDESDADTTNSANIQVIYSDHSISGVWDAGATWNREHVWAKSHGYGSVSNSTKGPGSDLHNLRACISNINSARNNRYFGECDVPYNFENIFTGSYYSTTEWLWEPRDEDKGDVARIMFYMATRYEGEGGEPDLELVEYLPANNSTEPIHAHLSDLLKWNEEDAVSAFERNRNEVIYGHQKNRNPFIDHPEYVNKIWVEPVVGISTEALSQIKLYPNPAKNEVYIKSDIVMQHIALYTLMGRKIKDIGPQEQRVFVGDLPDGQYLMRFTGKEKTLVLPLILIH